MKKQVNPGSLRARKARLARRFGRHGQEVVLLSSVIAIFAGNYCLYTARTQLGFGLIGLGILLLITALWQRYDLSALEPNPKGDTLDSILEPQFLGMLRAPLTPRRVWQAATATMEGRFVANHLLLDPKILVEHIDDDEKNMDAIWEKAVQLFTLAKPHELHAGIAVAAIIINSPAAQAVLTSRRLHVEETGEVLNWLERLLSYRRAPKPNFGGIGRDWASGYTPTLDSFSTNVSQQVEAMGGGGGFLAHSDLLDSVIASLSRGNAVALVGEDGVGKHDLVLGLAERLLIGKDAGLKYYQIVSLNAAHIVSYSGAQLEKLLLTIFGEAVAAGNIILFLDDAELFFGNGVGAFDMSQLLLPLLKNRNIRIIAAFTPGGWQQLQAQRPALGSGMTAISVKEPPEADTYKIIEDNTLRLEYQNQVIISYEAVREAYRLSGQYLQEQAYPAKAVTLLEQALPYADGNVITAESVQQAIEHTKGIKVSAAAAPEADTLLHLEEYIHERMINQTQAVSAVAAALRRGRAGVASPKRPIGSFLFLGPTGVGKTELARSLAAVYYGDAHQLIRLDMSEYQQAGDVSRLLATGSTTEQSLLMRIREQPFSVVLLDEIEKAHPSALNLLLQMLDEGQLSDSQGRPASFRSSIIIATSNAGASDITERVRTAGNLTGYERTLVDKLIAAGSFKPELINRFDDVVLFRPLGEAELGQVAQLMLQEVNKTLANQQLSVELTEAALAIIVKNGYDPEFGARPMRRTIQRLVEDTIATKILRGEAHPGDHLVLDATDLTSPDANAA